MPISTFPPALFATILSTLGYEGLSNATADPNLSIPTPITVFAPSDSSLRTCSECSLPLLLLEHSIPGLYSLRFLRSLAFGTKIETSAPNRCLTVTSSDGTPQVFVNGAEVTRPDLFNNGLVIVHGLKGFVSHLSPLSCSIESMTSLSFPARQPPVSDFLVVRLMLKEAMMRLRVNGYSFLALAMRVKYPDISDLKFLTVFAMGDESIFAGGEGENSYVSDLMLHVVPNRLLTGSDLTSLPKGTALPTMERGEKLVVTTAGDDVPLVPMRINFVKVKKFDAVHNERIVVHELSAPFPRLHHLPGGEGEEVSRE